MNGTDVWEDGRHLACDEILFRVVLDVAPSIPYSYVGLDLYFKDLMRRMPSRLKQPDKSLIGLYVAASRVGRPGHVDIVGAEGKPDGSNDRLFGDS